MAAASAGLSVDARSWADASLSAPTRIAASSAPISGGVALAAGAGWTSGADHDGPLAAKKAIVNRIDGRTNGT
jgi:hypothetical protein